MKPNLHQGQRILRWGADPNQAELVVILLHGRGATAESMLPLVNVLSEDKINFMIPQAGQNRWYPNSAFAPIETNEPDLTFALELIDSLVATARHEGFSDKQIAFGGFSQGACLALEYVARTPRRYGGLFAFTGALIGPPDHRREYNGNVESMPVFIGGSDVDPWVAHELLIHTAGVFEELGARVDFRTYPGLPHTINQDEVDAVCKMLLEAGNS
ncbi:MAG: dienelactone hydrolase family protein [Anaerolineales bacterium]|nr:dienelactone hydrolase family protein [Anaerolineales bacterium]